MCIHIHIIYISTIKQVSKQWPQAARARILYIYIYIYIYICVYVCI